MKNYVTFLFVFLCPLFSMAQNKHLIISKIITLPKDSIETKKLISSFNDLLIAKEKPNEENNFVWNKENVETYILLDEMKGIEKSGKYNDDFFFKPYLTNVVKINEAEYERYN